MNLYEELELSTSVTSKDAIVAAAKAKILEWNKNVNHPTKKLLVKGKVKTFNEIISLVENPDIIKLHAKEYQDILNKAKETQKKDIREQAQIFVVNGEIEAIQLKKLAQKYSAYTDVEILEILGATLKKEKVFAYKDDNIKEIDSSIMKTIATNLTIVQKADLYDFLGLARTSSAQEIEKRRADLQDQNSKNTNKDAKNTSTGLLCGQCINILCDPANRKSYDKTLDNLVFSSIREKIKTITSSVKQISAKQYESLLDECAKQRISHDKAEYFIYKYAKESNATIYEDTSNSFTKKIPCRICLTLNDTSATVCKSCAFPIVVVCPSCSHKSSNQSELKCTNCGFAIGDMPNALPEATEANKCLISGDIDNATKHLLRAESYWKTLPILSEIRKKLDVKTKEKEAAKDKILTLKKSKSYTTIKSLLGRGTSDNELQLILREAEQAINSAESLFTKCISISDPSKRLDAYMQILSICADFDKAKKEIQLNPPSAPTGVSIKTLGKVVSLTWNKPSSNFIESVVVRKLGARPSNYTDGEVLAYTNDDKYDDNNARVGESYFYSVFSRCGDIYSKSGSAVGPAMIIEDVDLGKLKIDIQEKHISFNYNIPNKAIAVEIYRNDKLIKSNTGSGFTDTGLTPETKYTYKFITVYEDCLGNKHKTNGVSTIQSPTTPASAIDLTVEDYDEKAIIKWQTPTKGLLEIFCSETPFIQNKNDLVNKDSFVGKSLSVVGNSTTIVKNYTGIKYYLPVVFTGNAGVVGNQKCIISILKPTDIEYNRIGDRTFETIWKWSTNVERVKIITQIDGGRNIEQYVGKTTPAKHSTVVPQGAKSLLISIQTVINDEKGQEILSDAVKKTFGLQTAKISFLEIKRGGFFSRNKFTLTMKSDSVLPCDLELLIGEGRTPIDLNNYRTYLTIKKDDVKIGVSQSFEFTYSQSDKKKPLLIRLIPSDQSMFKSLTIMPETKQIK